MTRTKTVHSSGSLVGVLRDHECSWFSKKPKSQHLCVYALHLGDNGPWEQKCEYAGSVGPFTGRWQTSRGMKINLNACFMCPATWLGVELLYILLLWVIKFLMLCFRGRLSQADHLGGRSQGANSGLLAWKDPCKHHQLHSAQVILFYVKWWAHKDSIVTGHSWLKYLHNYYKYLLLKYLVNSGIDSKFILNTAHVGKNTVT